jgi:pyruvate dehydrogenase E1 component beta subunit
MYANFPGCHVVAPANPYDAKGMLKSAIRDNNPVIFLECELLYGDKMEIPTEEYLVPLGKAQVARQGTDITLVSHSRMVKLCLEAAQEMAKKGVNVEVVDLRSIKPFDITTVAESVKKTNFCVLVEEGHLFAGICAEVGFQIQEHCFDFLDAPIERVCQRETPMPYSKALEKETLPTVQRIIRSIEKALHVNR